MQNEEIEDYHHHDFTTASEWEVFIARLEEIMHEWQLPRRKLGPELKSKDFINLEWDEKSEELNFADVLFILKHYKLKTNEPEEEEKPEEIENAADDEDLPTQACIDAQSCVNDFLRLEGDHLQIARYYGLREFLVLIPAKNMAITDETRIKILLSSLTMAVSNANCEIPALVQVQELWQRFYLGISVGKGTMAHLEMVHLKKVPPHCRYLTGLLSLFKQKITDGCTIRLEPIRLSARFSYVLKDWTNYTWTQDPPDFDFMQGETVGVAELGKLPFGATFDPVGELELFTSWYYLTESAIVDSEFFTDLEPHVAHEWSVIVKMVPSPACLLGEYLTDFLALWSHQKSLVDLLGDVVTYVDSSEGLSSAFNVLTESKIPTISKVVNKAAMRKNSKNVDGPIPEEVMISILYFLFPDAEEKPKTPYSDINSYTNDDDLWKGIKTCALDGLVWRLAIVGAHCTHYLGGAVALAQLWHEFVQEIRFRWEHSILIPGVGTGFPDSVRTCLLHQKLQMMNCCIERKKARETTANRQQSLDVDDFESESEEEFFECTEEAAENQAQQQAKKNHQKSKHLLWNRPVGRLAKHPTLLLLDTGDALYLPVTQDPVPKTEDQLEEDAQVMMQLGTDKYGSEMRARLMSASLLSDMESFKAANPGSQLGDFIRWYSPRDWIEDEGLDQWGQPAGHLSQRMKLENNPWSTTWSSAQPVPAHRQKRLFDDTREAEKAIHYLASKRLGQIAQLLIPALTHAALFTLSQQKHDALPNFSHVTQGIINKLQYATKPIEQKLQLYEEIVREISGVEIHIAQLNSLQHKLSSDDDPEEMTSFLTQLMQGKEVTVPGGIKGTIANRIRNMFNEAQKASHMMPSSSNSELNKKAFPEPSCKEFVLRSVIPRPTPASNPQPQRLYCCIKREYIRLAGFYSEDTTFL